MDFHPSPAMTAKKCRNSTSKKSANFRSLKVQMKTFTHFLEGTQITLLFANREKLRKHGQKLSQLLTHLRTNFGNPSFQKITKDMFGLCSHTKGGL